MDLHQLVERFSAEIRKLSVAPADPLALGLQLEKSEYLNAFLTEVPVVVSIFNHATFCFDYVSPNVSYMLGIGPEVIKAMNYHDFLKQYMHPADIELVALRLFPQLVEFVSSQPKEELLSTSVHYNYRMRAASGKWMRIEQQSSPLRVNAEGRILLEQSFYFQTGETEFDEPHSIELLISRRNKHGVFEPCFSRSYRHEKEAALPAQESREPREGSR